MYSNLIRENLVGIMITLKIAFRNLVRHKSRTIFAIICIILGVTLIGSVSIASFFIGFIGIAVGFVGGIIETYASFNNFSFNPLLNFVLLYPISFFLWTGGALIVLYIASGLIPAIIANKMDIVDAIRRRD